MKVFLTGGGSGGHILPNIALIEGLRAKQRTTPLALGYIGERGGMEEEMIRAQQVQFYGIYAGKIRRYFDIQNFFDPFKILLGFFQSLWIFWRQRPSVLFSKGGFVSVPVVFAAWCCRIPVIIHESDTTPGLATRITSRLATRICVAWKKTLSFFPEGKAILTGIPIRKAITQGDMARGVSLCGFTNTNKPTLLVIGGSLGAGALNDFVQNNLFALTKEMNVIHITGKGKSIVAHSDTIGAYAQFEFLGTELFDLYKASSLILSRAGSTLLWEFVELGIPAVLVPLPGHSSRGDQIDNALEYHSLYPTLSHVIPQESLTLDSFFYGIDILKKQTTEMKPRDLLNAREVIVEMLVGD